MNEANRFLREEYLHDHNERFSIAAEESGTAFIPWTATNLEEIFAIQEERTVLNDNTINYKLLHLQIPLDKHRFHYVKTKVRIHEYPDGAMGIFHGPRCLGRYDQRGNLADAGLKDAATRVGFSHSAVPKEGAKVEGRRLASAPS